MRAKKRPPRQGEAASINWTWGRVIVAHQENPMRRVVIFREQKYILLLSLVPVVSQHHFPDMVITISIQEWGSVDRVAGVKCPAKIVSLFLWGMHDGIIDCYPSNGNPSSKILVLLPQHLILGQNTSFRRNCSIPEFCNLFFNLMYLPSKLVIGRLFHRRP